MFVVELASVNDLRKHYSNDHFHSLMSKRLLVHLTAPLMDLRILLSAPKCITINVICETYIMVCLLGHNPGTRTKDGIEIEYGWIQES